MALRRRGLLLLASSAALLHLGCGSNPAGDPATPVAGVDEEAPAPRNAHTIASKVVGAKVTALIYVDKVRGHDFAPQVASMDAWGPIFDGTGITPLDDVDRAFVAAANARDQKSVIAVAEHRVEPARIEKALDTLVKRSGDKGERLDGFDFPAARVFVKERKSIVMAVTPTLLAVTSEPYANSAAKLAASGGLPDPTGPEAVIANAEQPSATLKAPRVPDIPESLSAARATVTMNESGGASVDIEADSSDKEQAKKDAETITKMIEEATTVKVAIIKIRAFSPIKFTAEGSKIKASHVVTKKEMATLLSVAQMMTNK